MLVGGLKPGRDYWYRFTDADGFGSRVGRTLHRAGARTTRARSASPSSAARTPTRARMNAYRRMIYEDERAPPDERLGFVLHLGDFIYEIVWYPEDRPQGMYDRRLRDIVRYPSTARSSSDFHLPTTLDDYRAVYRAYLHDPDLQDARARWPSSTCGTTTSSPGAAGRASQKFGDRTPSGRQTRKVAANQAWFEFQPARGRARPGALARSSIAPEGGRRAGRPASTSTAWARSPNNLAAIDSLTGYRALRFGRNVELILTDQHSYRSRGADRARRERRRPRRRADFPHARAGGGRPRSSTPGATYNGGKPPATIAFGDKERAQLPQGRAAADHAGRRAEGLVPRDR